MAVPPRLWAGLQYTLGCLSELLVEQKAGHLVAMVWGVFLDF